MELLRSSFEVAFLLPLLFFFLHILLMISVGDGRAVLCHAEERGALLQFKDGFLGDNMLSSWGYGEEDCCSWDGIICDNRTGHVVELHLQGEPYHLPLRGKINPSLAVLKYLRRLDLSWNNFEGSSIPPFLGSFQRLTYLDLFRANFSGFLPQHLRNISSLQVLDLSSNSFTGQLPSWLGEYKSLQVLNLDSNSLSGSVPESIGGMTSLKKFSLSRNNLMGSIPLSIGSLQSLEYLDLSKNNFTGPPPSSLWELKSLQHLDLSSNSLRGNLTEEHFVNLSKLTTLDLSSNSLQVILSPRWVPPFNLSQLGLGSCNLDSDFPLWLQTQKRLSDLNMSDANISGVLPQWLWNFSSYIWTMDLSMNYLRGVVPAATNSSWITDIILHSNMLEGSLSSFPPVRRTLLLSSNLFSGPINLIDMSSVMELSLSRNNLIGDIPPNFCGARWLVYLDLSYNHLSGQLPSCLGRWTSIPMCGIKSLQLNNNNIHGTLPESLENCKDMFLLDIGENNFSGEFPNWISNSMLQLKVLRLRSNSFYGSIPVELSNLKSLHVLDLADNNFSGSIPPTIGNFSGMQIRLSGDEQLSFSNEEYYRKSIKVESNGREMYASVLKLYTSMDLSGNKLSGDIPEEVGRLVYLRNLNLSHNYLSGHMPPTLSMLSKLESLDLSSNNLSGGIPETLSGLTFLSRFNVSYNNLSGRIPSGRQFDTFTNSCYMGNLDLCGKPLQVCQSDLSPPIKGYSMLTGQKDQDHYFVWLCLSIVLGFIMGFWTFLGTLFLKKNWRYAYFQFVDEQCEKYYLLVKIYAEKCKRMCLKS